MTGLSGVRVTAALGAGVDRDYRGRTVLGGMLMYPVVSAGDVVRFWRDFMACAPDELNSGVAFMDAPPLARVPKRVQGKPVVAVALCFAGDVAEGRNVLAPMLEFGPPVVNTVRPMPLVTAREMIDGLTSG